MAYKISKDGHFKLDNASASLTDISQWTNQASVQAAINMLETTGIGDSSQEFYPGLHGATIPVNGFINSTTSPIFSPIMAARTSITKTFSFYNGVRYFTGEAWPESVQMTGNVGELQTWSCTLRVSGAITSTSVTPS